MCPLNRKWFLMYTFSCNNILFVLNIFFFSLIQWKFVYIFIFIHIINYWSIKLNKVPVEVKTNNGIGQLVC